MSRSPWIIVVVLIVGFLAVRYFEGEVMRDALAATQAAEDSLAVLAPITDSLEAETAALGFRIDSLALTYTADSTAWEAERDSVDIIIEVEERTHDELALRVRERADSATLILVDSLLASHEIVVEAKDSQISSLESERVSLFEQRATLQMGFDAALSEIAAKDLELEQWSLANDGLHTAITAMNRRKWLERGAVVALAVGAFLLR